jgi:hypothetical protein
VRKYGYKKHKNLFQKINTINLFKQLQMVDCVVHKSKPDKTPERSLHAVLTGPSIFNSVSDATLTFLTQF